MPDKKKLNWRTDIVEALDRISKSMFKMTADAKTMEKSTRNMAEATEKARKEIVPQAEKITKWANSLTSRERKAFVMSDEDLRKLPVDGSIH